MANHANVLDVREEDRQVLQSRVQARTVSVRDRERAQFVLLAAGGCQQPRSPSNCSPHWRSRSAK